jgi:hypothetical protein
MKVLSLPFSIDPVIAGKENSSHKWRSIAWSYFAIIGEDFFLLPSLHAVLPPSRKSPFNSVATL